MDGAIQSMSDFSSGRATREALALASPTRPRHAPHRHRSFTAVEFSSDATAPRTWPLDGGAKV